MFKASFEEAQKLVTRKFISEDIGQFNREPNFLKKILGAILFPFFIVAILIIQLQSNNSFFDFSSSRFGSDLSYMFKIAFLGISIVWILTVMVILVICIRRKLLFLRTFHLIMGIDILMLSILLQYFIMGLFRNFTNQLTEFLVVATEIVLLAFLIFRRIKIQKEILNNVNKMTRKYDTIFKWIADNALWLFLIGFVFESIIGVFFSGNSDGKQQFIKIILLIVLPIGCVGTSYFAVSYSFFDKFFSIYYLDKYLDKFELKYAK